MSWQIAQNLERIDMNVSVSSIPSPLPDWYDPNAPNFKPPKSWTCARIRIHVPISTATPNQEMAEARAVYEKKYPGALLHLVPEFNKLGKPDEIKITGSDHDLLEQYFSKIELPEYITIGQLTAYLSKYLPRLGVFGVQGFEFCELDAENVLCFEKVHWDMQLNGLTLVTGKNTDWGKNISNGAGKSSFTSLPFIALFGRTFKKQTHDGWANQNNEKKACLTLNIKLKDHRKVTIYRSRRPQLLRVWVDGKEETMGSPSATQTLIETLTGFTWEILENAVYIGQHELGSVFGTEKERKELFSRLLGLDRFLLIQDKLRKSLSKLNRTISEFEVDTADAVARLEESEHSMRSVKTRLKNTACIEEHELVALRNKESKLNQDLEESSEQRDESEEKLRTINKRISFEGSEVAGIRARIEIHSEALSDLKKLKDKCITCKQPVSKSFVKNEMDKLRLLIDNEEIEEQVHIGKCKRLEIQRRDLEIKVTHTDRQTRLLQSGLTKLSSEIQDLEAHKAMRDGIKNELRTAQERVDKNKRVAEVNKQALKYTLEDRKFLEIGIESVGRNGLPAFLCSSIAPQLNKTVAFYSEVFTEGEITVQFHMENGDIELEIENQHGGKTIEDQSAGEMSIAARMVALTFRDVLVPLNLLILDEPSEGLDSENSLNFARGLKQIKSKFEHIVIITHNAHILGALEPDHRITIVKENKNSGVMFV
jgi:DNA repair exonuclease SbcCD ATPase subunit